MYQPSEAADELRLEKARALLKYSSLGIQEVAKRAGFDRSTSLTRWCRQRTATTPGEYRQRRHQAT